MKSGMNVMPVEPTSYILILTIRNYNVVDAQTCEVGASLAPLDKGSWNNVW